MKFVLLVSLLSLALNANAENKYMKLDKEIGGWITISTEPCEVPKFKDEFPLKAILENGSGETRRGCWYKSEEHWNDKFKSQVLIKEEIILPSGNELYPVGSFAQYYFEDTK